MLCMALGSKRALKVLPLIFGPFHSETLRTAHRPRGLDGEAASGRVDPSRVRVRKPTFAALLSSLRSSSAHVSLTRRSCPRCRSARASLMFGQFGPTLGQVWPKVGQHRPTSVKAQPKCEHMVHKAA